MLKLFSLPATLFRRKKRKPVAEWRLRAIRRVLLFLFSLVTLAQPVARAAEITLGELHLQYSAEPAFDLLAEADNRNRNRPESVVSRKYTHRTKRIALHVTVGTAAGSQQTDEEKLTEFLRGFDKKRKPGAPYTKSDVKIDGKIFKKLEYGATPQGYEGRAFTFVRFGEGFVYLFQFVKVGSYPDELRHFIDSVTLTYKR